MPRSRGRPRKYTEAEIQELLDYVQAKKDAARNHGRRLSDASVLKELGIAAYRKFGGHAEKAAERRSRPRRLSLQKLLARARRRPEHRTAN